MPKVENSSTEIELTYLLREIPIEIKDTTAEKMLDVYILGITGSPVLRIRQRGSTYEITKKTPVHVGDFSSHIEQTIPLDHVEFTVLCGTSKLMVEKERYVVTIDGFAAEVDVFSGALAGLALVDFEFPDEDAKSQFRVPHCCLADVTQEQFVLGGQLAGKRYADIEEVLEKFAYKKLSS